MGKKGNWFSTVKKALSPDSKKSSKPKKKWFGKQKLQTSDPSLEDTAPPLPSPEDVRLTDIDNQNNHHHVPEITAVVVTEDPGPSVPAPVVRTEASVVAHFAGKPKDEVAAIKIQTAFRGYLARRALRALRGLVRLKTLMEGPIVKRQAMSTLRSMQTLARVQSQIRSRRVRMLEEIKFLLTTLLLLCTIATLFHFIPSSFTISASDLRLCISRISQTPPSPSPSPQSPPQASSIIHEKLTTNNTIKRFFNPYGSAAYNFITMSAYRGGLNTFAIIGLSSKPLHVYGNPSYECEWIPYTSTSSEKIITNGYKILPDWGYGHVYTVVVVNCTFNDTINGDNNGGKLMLYASTLGGGDRSFNVTDKMEVLVEHPKLLDHTLYDSKPKFEFLYCGSSLYGNLNPQRVREWIAYHVRLFGPKSHFVIHDAGGVHEEVLEVLKPWIELGYVTLQDIRDEERFDGYYHNQFMVVNDCLHRYKFMAKWMFFFDVDEYIYVPPKSTIKTVVDSLSQYSQFTIEQMAMSGKVCLQDDYGKTYRKWGFEKLVYRDAIRGIRRDRKYAVQPRNLYATGVHMSENLDGNTTHKTEGRIKYFHYHGTIAQRRETCKLLVNSTKITYEKTPYVLDTTMRDIAAVIKKFELKMIGSRLQNTRQ